MFRDNFVMAMENIINNKVRSFLTMLGIMIGVAAIIALITSVNGATEGIKDIVESFGYNKITLQITGTPLKPGLLTSDLEDLRNTDNVKGISPNIQQKTSVIYKEQVYEDVTLYGKNTIYFYETDDVMENGRVFNTLDIRNNNRVCLIGNTLENNLFCDTSAIGKKIVVGGIEYTIIGTLQSSGGFALNNFNEAVIMPYTTAMNHLGTRYMNNVDIYMVDEKLSQQTTKSIDSKLTTAFNHKENAFTIFNLQSMINSIDKMTRMMSLLLVGIAGISLVVGGIGIMNMMLVSVTERTKEIGLRKALGAEPKTIQQLFLLEAVMLSTIGGAVGVFLGAVLAYVVCKALGNPYVLNIYTIILAVFFSIGVGIIFGIAPARKASRLNPIDALRSQT